MISVVQILLGILYLLIYMVRQSFDLVFLARVDVVC